MHPFLLRADSSVLLLIDLQEGLLPVIARAEELLKVTKRLMEVAQKLHIPTVLTEQYPKGLGHTASSLNISRFTSTMTCLEKTHFSCSHEEICMEELHRIGKRQIVLAGIETHICVLSTALGLLEKGFSVVIAGDAVSSRKGSHHRMALGAAAQAGALVIPEESIVYQWLYQSGTADFKAILPFYKA